MCQPQYTWDCAWAVRTVMCESGGDPSAQAGPHWGLWQIDYWFEAWDDPAINTERAWWKYQEAIRIWGDGRHPWPWCGYQ